MGRALVADHVERRQHGGPGGVRDPGLAVEHAAHGRLTDPDLLGDLSEPPGGSSRHAATIRHLAARVCVTWITYASRSVPGFGMLCLLIV